MQVNTFLYQKLIYFTKKNKSKINTLFYTFTPIVSRSKNISAISIAATTFPLNKLNINIHIYDILTLSFENIPFIPIIAFIVNIISNIFIISVNVWTLKKNGNIDVTIIKKK